MSHSPDSRPPGRPAPADRLARVLRRLRWPVLIVWVLALVLLYPLARGLSDVTNGTAAANLPASAPSTRVVQLEQAPGQPDVDTATVVFARDGGLTAADLTAVAAARSSVAGLAGHVQGLGTPGPAQRSADGQADEFTADVTAPASSETSTDTAAVQAIRGVVSGPASRAGGGLRTDVTGSAAVNADSGVSGSAQDTLLLTALVIIMVILILVYRSPVLWLLPLFGALGAIVVAEAAAHGLANAGFTVSTLSASILRVLVLGAATDYALLLIHRYREELRRHAATEDAMAAVVLLGAAVAGLAALHIDNDPLAEVKGHPGSVTGAQLLSAHYGPGVNAPLAILAPPREATAAAAAARATPDVAAVSPGAPVGGYASYSVTLSVPPYGASGSAAVGNLRGQLGRDAPGSLVGGDPAVQDDISQAAHRDTLLLIPLVLVVIGVIIGLLLRAVVAPLLLVATTALSFAAAFGLSSLLWRYGFGYSGIEAQLPLYIFIFLVALGVDYNGIAVALGVLLDTLLVRTVLVPASLLILGERVWWPARLAGPGQGQGRHRNAPVSPGTPAAEPGRR